MGSVSTARRRAATGIFIRRLVVLRDDDRYTLPVALANLVGEHLQDTELMMAGAVLTVLPLVVLFVACSATTSPG